jgi:DNA polymerase I
VTIKTDVKISLNDRDCQIQEPDKEALIHAFDELEFRTFIARLTGGKTAPTKKKSEAGVTQMSLFDQSEPAPTTIYNMDSIENVAHDYQLVEDEKILHEIVGQIKNSGVFCFDTETTGLNPHEAEILGIAIAVGEGKAFYVPCNTEKLPMKIIRNVLSPLFEDPELLKVGQNIKYDIIVLHYAEIVVAGPLFDTMLAHYLLQPEARHNMDFLAETYLNYQTVSIEELIGKKGVNQGNMKDVPLETLKEYACEDADVTLRLFHVLQKEIQKNNLEDIANHIEMPLVYVLAQMECNGVYIDKDSLAVFAEKLKKQLQEVEKNIYELADNKTFNIASPKQLGEVLFDQLKIDEKAKRTKTKQYSTSEETLEKLKDKHPIINKILEYRGLKKLISTYVEALPLLINSKTGKIHTSYNQSVTSTGRLSSTNPNLQNIPIREEQGREIRKAFVSSEKEHVLLAADYSQIELRIMAHLSEDKAMQEAFKNNEDIHTSTAAKIYGVRPEEITSDQRRKAKTANFGIIYGISPFGLSQRLSIPRAEADDLIKGYFTSYPGVRDYMEQVKENARGKGFVQTIFGRRRYLRDINSSNAIVRGVAERNAINAPIQGSAADLIKMAMIRIYEELKKSKLSAKMILQVHDELVFDVSTDELDQLKKLVQKEMENIYKLDVPLIVDMGAGNSWLEAH